MSNVSQTPPKSPETLAKEEVDRQEAVEKEKQQRAEVEHQRRRFEFFTGKRRIKEADAKGSESPLVGLLVLMICISMSPVLFLWIINILSMMDSGLSIYPFYLVLIPLGFVISVGSVFHRVPALITVLCAGIIIGVPVLQYKHTFVERKDGLLEPFVFYAKVFYRSDTEYDPETKVVKIRAGNRELNALYKDIQGAIFNRDRYDSTIVEFYVRGHEEHMPTPGDYLVAEFKAWRGDDSAKKELKRKDMEYGKFLSSTAYPTQTKEERRREIYAPKDVTNKPKDSAFLD